MGVPSTSKQLAYEGRFVHDSDGAHFDWPLTAIHIRMECTLPGHIQVRLQGGQNRFSATLFKGNDMQRVDQVTFTAGRLPELHTVGHIEEAAIYVLRLRKLTEAS